jgi:GTP-binding protein
MLDYRKIAFLKSATAISHFPAADLPEVAIVGRSNVGKSSLLNMLGDHRGMARVSKTPGRTQLINFFTVGDRARIVDLPGYGYADVPENIQRTWDKMMHDYLAGRELLLGLLLLIDIRRMPSEHDKMMLGWCFERELPVLIVLTKCDKVGRNEAFNQQHKIAKDLGISPKLVIQTSASKKTGLDALRDSLDALFDEYFESLDDSPDEST